MNPDKEKEIEKILKEMEEDRERADDYFNSGQMAVEQKTIIGLIDMLGGNTSTRRRILKEFVGKITFLLAMPERCYKQLIDAELAYDAGEDFKKFRSANDLKLPPMIVEKTKQAIKFDQENQADYIGVLKAFLFVRSYLVAALMESGVSERFKDRLRQTEQEKNT